MFNILRYIRIYFNKLWKLIKLNCIELLGRIKFQNICQINFNILLNNGNIKMIPKTQFLHISEMFKFLFILFIYFVYFICYLLFIIIIIIFSFWTPKIDFAAHWNLLYKKYFLSLTKFYWMIIAPNFFFSI